MRLRVVVEPKGSSVEIDVLPQIMVLAVKEILFLHTGIPVLCQSLSLRGRPLEDTDVLKDVLPSIFFHGSLDTVTSNYYKLLAASIPPHSDRGELAEIDRVRTEAFLTLKVVQGQPSQPMVSSKPSENQVDSRQRPSALTKMYHAELTRGGLYGFGEEFDDFDSHGVGSATNDATNTDRDSYAPLRFRHDRDFDVLSTATSSIRSTLNGTAREALQHGADNASVAYCSLRTAKPHTTIRAPLDTARGDGCNSSESQRSSQRNKQKHHNDSAHHHFEHSGAILVPRNDAPPQVLPEDIFRWTPEHTAAWVASLGGAYHEYCHEFVESGIDGRMLLEISRNNADGQRYLQELGVKTIHAAKILFNLRLRMSPVQQEFDSHATLTQQLYTKEQHSQHHEPVTSSDFHQRHTQARLNGPPGCRRATVVHQDYVPLQTPQRGSRPHTPSMITTPKINTPTRYHNPHLFEKNQKQLLKFRHQFQEQLQAVCRKQPLAICRLSA